MGLFKNENGMSITGQGPKIVRFTLPFAVAAVLAHFTVPNLARLPFAGSFLSLLGAILLLSGLALWITGLIQLIVKFPKGKLITSGAYGVCRNPIYSSFVLFIFPGISFLTGTWVYFIASFAMAIAIRKFVRKEEEQLLDVFGPEYGAYTLSVCRVLPFIRPAKR